MRAGTYYRKEMLRRIGLVPPPRGTVLEVGCHDGAILHHTGGGFRVGVDIRPRPRYPIHYVQGDGCRLPFRPETFEWIFALEVIEHVQRRRDLVESAVQVLKPGGTLVLSVPHRGMKVFPAPLTGLVHRLWGHEPGFRGLSEGEIRALIPTDSVAAIHFLRWRGLSFLRGFFLLRTMWQLVQPVGRRWVRGAAERDAREQRDDRDGYLLFAIISKA